MLIPGRKRVEGLVVGQLGFRTAFDVHGEDLRRRTRLPDMPVSPGDLPPGLGLQLRGFLAREIARTYVRGSPGTAITLVKDPLMRNRPTLLAACLAIASVAATTGAGTTGSAATAPSASGPVADTIQKLCEEAASALGPLGPFIFNMELCKSKKLVERTTWERFLNVVSQYPASQASVQAGIVVLNECGSDLECLTARLRYEMDSMPLPQQQYDELAAGSCSVEGSARIDCVPRPTCTEESRVCAGTFRGRSQQRYSPERPWRRLPCSPATRRGPRS